MTHIYHTALDNERSILAGDLPYTSGFKEIPIYDKLHILKMVLFLVPLSSLLESLFPVSLVVSLSFKSRKNVRNIQKTP